MIRLAALEWRETRDTTNHGETYGLGSIQTVEYKATFEDTTIEQGDSLERFRVLYRLAEARRAEEERLLPTQRGL